MRSLLALFVALVSLCCLSSAWDEDAAPALKHRAQKYGRSISNEARKTANARARSLGALQPRAMTTVSPKILVISMVRTSARSME